MTRIVYIEGEDQGVVKMFRERGWYISDGSSEEDCDAVVLTGGPDICPFLYGEDRHPKTLCDIPRDKREVRLLKSLSPKFPKIGICRGAQLLNVLAGGKLWQHVDNHQIKGLHDITDCTSGQILHVTSTHHQMMEPSTEAFWIAVAKESIIKQTDKERKCYTPKMREAWDDPEVLYYAPFNSLCFQPHPEYVQRGHPCQEYFFDLIEMYCFATP